MRLREQRGRPPVEVAPLQLDLLESLQHHGERLLLRRRARRGRGAHRPAVACRGYRHDLQLGEAVGEGRLRRLRIRLRGRGGRARQQQQSACWQRRLVRAARAPLRIRELARRSGRRMTAALAPPRKRSAPDGGVSARVRRPCHGGLGPTPPPATQTHAASPRAPCVASSLPVPAVWRVFSKSRASLPPTSSRRTTAACRRSHPSPRPRTRPAARRRGRCPLRRHRCRSRRARACATASWCRAHAGRRSPSQSCHLRTRRRATRRRR
mmetsp:Transcript_24394/g.78338  ORF Transcript_24394/g.78338 Transcript_24394/m.78338 type:complete len:267 (+) Transcript_24394:391-1191(+)